MTRARRVLVLNHFAVPRGYPGGTRHVEMFGRLRGWRHLIVASRYNLTTGEIQHREPGFWPVWVTPYKGNGPARVVNWCSYLVSALLAGLRLARKPPDLIYASSPHLFAGAAGYMLARAFRRPFVLEIRDLWPKVLLDMGQLQSGSLIYRGLAQLERILYRHADAIVTMAPGTGAHLRETGVPAQKVSYIPNGADPADFTPGADRDTLRRRYNFVHFTAVYTGAHGPANGLTALVEAAEQLDGEPVEIVLVGDGPEKQWLKEMAADRGLTNIRFLDPIPKSAIPDLLHAADLGLHILADVALFRTAVSPNKLFDYMAAGLPVLTNSPGVVGDWVSAAGAGWCVTTPDLAEQLRRAARTVPEELVRHGELGRAWLAEHQSRSAMTHRLARLLGDVDRHGRGHAPVTVRRASAKAADHRWETSS